MSNDLLTQRYKLISGYPAGDTITEEVFDLEAKAKHFDNIIKLLTSNQYEEIIVSNIEKYCEEHNIDIRTE